MIALIIGVSGQAGSYLAEYLTSLNYEVIGTWCHHPCYDLLKNIKTVNMDICSSYEISRMLSYAKPDEIYNMASLMFAPASWQDPAGYFEVNALGATEILDKLVQFGMTNTKYFQAGSAEVFAPVNKPIHESTPRRPRSPYGISKLAAEETTRIYREEKGVYATTGIFFNMESPRRADTFFSVKVAKAVAAIQKGKQQQLVLGDLSACRDWGWTPDYVRAAHKMLQSNTPRDYIIGTGEQHSCYEFVKQAFLHAGFDTITDELLSHKTERWDTKDVYWANPNKIAQDLGWRASNRFHDVVCKLVDAELARG